MAKNQPKLPSATQQDQRRNLTTKTRNLYGLARYDTKDADGNVIETLWLTPQEREVWKGTHRADHAGVTKSAPPGKSTTLKPIPAPNFNQLGHDHHFTDLKQLLERWHVRQGVRDRDLQGLTPAVIIALSLNDHSCNGGLLGVSSFEDLPSITDNMSRKGSPHVGLKIVSPLLWRQHHTLWSSGLVSGGEGGVERLVAPRES